jgi:hypothetical protein
MAHILDLLHSGVSLTHVYNWLQTAHEPEVNYNVNESIYKAICYQFQN